MNKEQFSGCVFNPLVDGKILDTYPALLEIVSPEAKQHPYIDSILRYAIMVYDPKSPLIPKEKDLNRRKSTAAELAGFDLSDEESMAKVYSGEDEVVLWVITRYLIRFAKNMEFAALCAFHYKYYENISELLTPIKGDSNTERLEAAKKKSVISDEIDKDIKRIDDYWDRLYGDNELIKQVKAKRITPESVSIDV